MNHARAVLALALALLTSSCGDDVVPESLEPPRELPEIYRLLYAGPEQHALFRAGTDIEVRVYMLGDEDEYLGRGRGQLDSATSEELDVLIDALLGGEQSVGELPGSPGLDGTLVELSLGEFAIVYAYGLAPSGLAEIDVLLRTVYHDLLNCRDSDLVTPGPDCEIVTAYPG